MTDDVVISAEGLGKKYLIGHRSDRERHPTLRDVMARSARNLVRTVADTLRGSQILVGGATEEVWALKDVDFEVRRGEVVGVIGRNGAGKSTLLKVLSRITEPTLGQVVIDGRVASLLEVGTGFHQELTGRENVYLNGAILGMSRAEIRRKFDEIVAFADVERFLDTPVKHYSSGMYVRLAFAVAAHLEPEILIVDEVLAVGDAAFQKKCLGRMSDVARSGRTVLFVSHNMAAVKNLTHRALVISRGQVVFDGATDQAVEKYSALNASDSIATSKKPFGHGKHTTIRSAALVDESGAQIESCPSGLPIAMQVEFETDGTRDLSIEVLIVDQIKTKVAFASLAHFQGMALPSERGVYRLAMQFAPLHLAAGQYTLDIGTTIPNVAWDHYVTDALTFDVPYCNPGQFPFNFLESLGLGDIALPLARKPQFQRLK